MTADRVVAELLASGPRSRAEATPSTVARHDPDRTPSFSQFDRLSFVSRRTGAGRHGRRASQPPLGAFDRLRRLSTLSAWRRLPPRRLERLRSPRLAAGQSDRRPRAAGRRARARLLQLDGLRRSRPSSTFATQLVAALGVRRARRAPTAVRIACLGASSEPRGFGPFGAPRPRMPELVASCSQIAPAGLARHQRRASARAPQTTRSASSRR